MKKFLKGCLLCAVLTSHVFAANEMKTAKKTVNKTREQFSLNTQQRACIENKIGSIERSTVTQSVRDQAYRDCGINLAQRRPHMQKDNMKGEYMEDNVNTQKSSTRRDHLGTGPTGTSTDWRDTPTEEVPIVNPTNK